VNNDFHQPRTIFDVLEGLEAPGLDTVPTPEAKTNGTTTTTNGVKASAAPQ